MLSCVLSQTVDQIPDESSAKRLAELMPAQESNRCSWMTENSSRKSLRFLEHFTFLKYLTVGGHARDLEAVTALTRVAGTVLLRVTIPDFAFLAGLHGLRLLDIRFGGCKAFDTLAEAKHLIGLSFLRLPTLKEPWLRRVDAAFATARSGFV